MIDSADSNGGEALASTLTWKAMRLFRGKKLRGQVCIDAWDGKIDDCTRVRVMVHEDQSVRVMLFPKQGGMSIAEVCIPGSGWDPS